ncbi:MAG: hypothetical protein KJS95_02975 [Gammaproteobacteria bacterium]|nr:hypothetical protein [Gammaproteobacteria bacterium]
MPYMVRTFDMAGYYETRLLLTLVALAFACHMWRRGDRRFLVAYAAGVLFQSLLEWQLSVFGMRGPFQMRFFGLPFSGLAASSLQGFVEGGPLTLMGYWFASCVRSLHGASGGSARIAGWRGYAAGLVVVFSMAVATILIASPAQVTSARAMIAPTGGWVDWFFPGLAAASFLIAALSRGPQGLRFLGYCVIGVFVYAIVVFEPLQWAGLRFVGYREGAGFVAAPAGTQALWMFYSLLIEVALFKAHHFALPIALGLLDAPRMTGTAGR